MLSYLLGMMFGFILGWIVASMNASRTLRGILMGDIVKLLLAHPEGMSSKEIVNHFYGTGFYITERSIALLLYRLYDEGLVREKHVDWENVLDGPRYEAVVPRVRMPTSSSLTESE